MFSNNVAHTSTSSLQKQISQLRALRRKSAVIANQNNDTRNSEYASSTRVPENSHINQDISSSPSSVIATSSAINIKQISSPHINNDEAVFHKNKSAEYVLDDSLNRSKSRVSTRVPSPPKSPPHGYKDTSSDGKKDMSSPANLEKATIDQYMRQLQTTFKLLLESNEEQAKLRTLLDYSNVNSNNDSESNSNGIVESLTSLINEVVDQILYERLGSNGSSIRDNYKYLRNSTGVLSSSSIFRYAAIDRENRRIQQQLLRLKSALDNEQQQSQQSERAIEILRDQLNV